MKKMKLVFAALVAACAVALTGCPEVHSDVKWGLTQPEYVVGDVGRDSTDQSKTSDMWGTKVLPLVWSSEVPSVATVEFSYSGKGWNDEGNAAFKFVEDTTGSGALGGSDVTATDNGDLKFDLSGGNVVIKGLSKGKTYILTVTADYGEKPALSIETK